MRCMKWENVQCTTTFSEHKRKEDKEPSNGNHYQPTR
jgi:hypothetical protein